ncbi:hypothetical protein EX30DRAFT_398550 [Ascodesmis nigricans]|uniref:DNA repair and recombination protein RAD26 n=1 Tax=Ascodesmis nigricans TaxID=341454 RepID=A0A4S2MRF4_9PEZI|nr:hypothetical protein EX30DRAFT_398550 [Ascodesmis nigricans]
MPSPPPTRTSSSRTNQLTPVMSQLDIETSPSPQDAPSLEQKQNPEMSEEATNSAHDKVVSQDEDGYLGEDISIVSGVRAIDQEDLETNAYAQAEMKVLEGVIKRDQKLLEKTDAELEKLSYQRDQLKPQPNTESKIKELESLTKRIGSYMSDRSDIVARIKKNSEQWTALRSGPVAKGNKRLPGETEVDFLIRTGKITPFAARKLAQGGQPGTTTTGETGSQTSAQNLKRPGFATIREDISPAKVKKQPSPSYQATSSEEEEEEESDVPPTKSVRKRKIKPKSDDEDFKPSLKKSRSTGARRETKRESSAEYSEPSASETESSDDDYYVGDDIAKKPSKRKSGASRTSASGAQSAQAERLDDGDENIYQKRLKEWSKSRQASREQQDRVTGRDPITRPDLPEYRQPHPSEPDLGFDDTDFKIPGDIHPVLFDYQKVGVEWLWQLHCEDVGGILGDEMGLGKTVQVVTHIAGLHYSGMLDRPVLIVAAGTLMKQWAKEFHTWWPALRVSILHKSGSGMLVDRGSDDGFEEMEEELDDDYGTRSSSAARKIVNRVFRDGHILITTYEGLTTYGDLILNKDWSYAILDEGHKIRNPDAKVTLTCKQLRTKHRLILSGTPIQNNLVELWSLFDFVYPGRLGDLPTFKEVFEIPIRSGGYKNANNLAVRAAEECAKILREQIGPFMLRRIKNDVLTTLPEKKEQVLCCKLSTKQEQRYIEFLKGPEVRGVLAGNIPSLAGIDALRKICNHPDLLDHELQRRPGYKYGDPSLSSKLSVTLTLLQSFSSSGHRTLVFSQGIQMLDIIESSVKPVHKYLRMDGKTPTEQRSGMVDLFNADSSIKVFLLTTRVGGLGLNLTGADRVILFDPDWNPSTDVQARERAWRIGQKKSVEIYRLMTRFTIEEKMYKRQLFKIHVAQKVLSTASTAGKRIFEEETMRDLFTYGEESSGMFRDARRSRKPTVTIPNQPPRTSTNNNEDFAISIEEYRLANPSSSSPSISTREYKNPETAFIESIFSNNSNILETFHHVTAADRDHHLLDRPPSTTTASKYSLSASDQYVLTVGAEARQRLLESSKAAQESQIDTITWTGKSGIAGKPRAATAPRSRESSAVDSRPLRAQLLEAFRAKEDGKMTTEELKKWCVRRGIGRGGEGKDEFRKALREVAEMDKVRKEFTVRRKWVRRK